MEKGLTTMSMQRWVIQLFSSRIIHLNQIFNANVRKARLFYYIGTLFLYICRACNTLRCLSCDFKVLYFDNLRWSPSVNYLYFRNNVPDTSKLRAKLQRSSGLQRFIFNQPWLMSNDDIFIIFQGWVLTAVNVHGRVLKKWHYSHSTKTWSGSAGNIAIEKVCYRRISNETVKFNFH